MQMIILGIIPLILVAIILAMLKTDANLPKLAVGATVSIILVAAALVPALNLFEDDDDTSLEYDDYFASDATSASGALELVQVNGITYAHAADVGDGTLMYADGTSATFTVSPAVLDVFLFMGQSNIAYWEGKYINGVYESHAIPEEVTPTLSPGMAYYYGSDSSPYTPDNKTLSNQGIYDMVDTASGSLKIGSLDAPFAANYVLESGHKCLVINCGWSGQSISSFIQGGAVYNHAKVGYNDAISKIDENFVPFIKGYVFCQGEADRLMSVDDYKTKFINMHTQLTTGSFSATHLPVCYIDLIRQYWGGNAYSAQIDLASEIKTVNMSSTISSTFSIENGLLMSDNLHYTQQGQNLIANQLVENILH